MFAALRPAVVSFVLLSALTGIAYPWAVTAVAQVVFPHQANGSLIRRDGEILGSSLIGQACEDARYFWSRPSATGPFPYNGTASSGSNLGPTNPDLLAAVKDRVANIRKEHPEQTGPIPADMVTASGSGLDPHISPAAAEFQAQRIARVRNLPIERVRSLIAANTASRTLGLLGEPRVNVLELNLALDQAR